MGFWGEAAAFAAAAVVYVSFVARRTRRGMRAGDSPSYQPQSGTVLVLAAIVGADFGKAPDRGFAMALVVIAVDLAATFGWAAVLFNYRARWRPDLRNAVFRSAASHAQCWLFAVLCALGTTAVLAALIARLPGS